MIKPLIRARAWGHVHLLSGAYFSSFWGSLESLSRLFGMQLGGDCHFLGQIGFILTELYNLIIFRFLHASSASKIKQLQRGKTCKYATLTRLEVRICTWGWFWGFSHGSQGSRTLKVGLEGARGRKFFVLLESANANPAPASCKASTFPPLMLASVSQPC